jgi:hypothetical protein
MGHRKLLLGDLMRHAKLQLLQSQNHPRETIFGYAIPSPTDHAK